MPKAKIIQVLFFTQSKKRNFKTLKKKTLEDLKHTFLSNALYKK